MSSLIKTLGSSARHTLFPHCCEGCGMSMVDRAAFLCVQCMSGLPRTEYEAHSANPVEQRFWGRLPVKAAAAQYYFTKGGVLQRVMHAFKYTNHPELAEYMGRGMGRSLSNTVRYDGIDALIPLPLHPRKERKRGYNQSFHLCKGMGEALNVPVDAHSVIRTTNTESQTKKGRIERWLNVEGRFAVRNEEAIRGKHLLLVDDVLTTGATLEACGREILAAGAASLSIAVLGYAGEV